MTVRMLMLATTLFAAAAVADDSADQAKLVGTWQVQNETGKASNSVWILEEKADAIHITNLQDDQKVAEFECNTLGKECAIKDAGHKATVSVWFSGPKLVELETKGSEVVKRRFAIAGQGDTMQLEVIPIVPADAPQTKVLKRVQASASKP